MIVNICVIVCDNCGDPYHPSSPSLKTEKEIREDILDSDWYVEEPPSSKHYCPDCWHLDLQENLIIENKPTLI